MLIELDQVPIIPCRFGHRLITVVEDGVAERIAVPLEARHLTGLAADAGRGIDQLANLLRALHAGAGHGSGMPALGSTTVGVSRLTIVLASLPASS